DQPLLRARMLATVGQLYCKLGLPLECKSTIEQALALHRAQSDPDPLVTADYLYYLGSAGQELAEDVSTQSALREALALLESRVPASDLRIVRILRELGQALISESKFDEAVTTLEKARDLRVLAGDEDSAEYADVLGMLATVYVKTGKT